MTRIGDLAWAAAGSGKMSRSDRMNQLACAVGLRLGDLARRWFRSRSAPALDLGRVVMPDTRHVRDAIELCTQNSSDSLANHCFRAFFWGSLLAQRSNLDYDQELFCIAALLHDLALTKRFGFTSAEFNCFAYEGAVAAGRFALDRRWSREKARKLGDAICLHLNVFVPIKAGVEAHLVRAGSGFDVIGARFCEIDRSSREQVVERYPRLGFKREIEDLAAEQARRRPGCRMEFLMDNGFARMIRHAPFDD